MLPWMRKGKEGNDEKEMHSMDIDSINIIFGTGSRCDGKNKFKKPLGVLANGVDGQVVLSWESVQGADGYEVFEKAEEENVFLKLRATKQCKLVFKNKKRGSVYQYKVRAYKIYKKNGEEKRIYSSFGAVARTTVAKTQLLRLKIF